MQKTQPAKTIDKQLLYITGLFFLINTVLFFFFFYLFPKFIPVLSPDNYFQFINIQQIFNAFVIVVFAFTLKYQNYSWKAANAGIAIFLVLGLAFSVIFNYVFGYGISPTGIIMSLLFPVLLEWIYAIIAFKAASKISANNPTKKKFLLLSGLFILLVFAISIAGSMAPTSETHSGFTMFAPPAYFLLIGVPIILQFLFMFLPGINMLYFTLLYGSPLVIWILYYFAFFYILFFSRLIFKILIIILHIFLLFGLFLFMVAASIGT